jgi:hypothetical protein
MPLFAVLGGLMTLGGVALALWLPNTFSAGGWATGAFLVVFAFLLRRSHQHAAIIGPTLEAEANGASH